MNRMTRAWILALFVAVSTGAFAQREAPAVKPEHIVAFVFDWDDNIFNMPTQIMIFHKKTHKELGISTAEYALERDKIGKPETDTKYPDYEESKDPSTGSLRYFGDSSEDGTRRFLKDIKTAMRGPHWQGPVWKDFVSASSRKKTTRYTWLITARLHSASTIHGALEALQAKKLTKNVPPVENIWPVNAPGFTERFSANFHAAAPGGSASSPSARKAAVMEQMLDRFERVPIPPNTPKVLSPDGKKRGHYHLWGFSDDDYGNFSTAITVLQKGLDQGRWPHMKITVFYTGTNRPDVKPHAVTLVPHAAPRPHHDGAAEWGRLLSRRDGGLLERVP
jgi:hypothetical protein